MQKEEQRARRAIEEEKQEREEGKMNEDAAGRGRKEWWEILESEKERWTARGRTTGPRRHSRRRHLRSGTF